MDPLSLMASGVGLIYASAVIVQVLWRMVKDVTKRKNVAKTFFIGMLATSFSLITAASIEYIFWYKPVSVTPGGLFKGLLAVDGFSLSIGFAVIASSLIISLFVVAKMDFTKTESGMFLSVFLVLVASALSVTLSSNFIVLIVFWETCVGAALGLLAYNMNRESGEALMKMALISIMSGLSLIVGVGLLYVSIASAVDKPLNIYSLNFDVTSILISGVTPPLINILLLSFAFIIASIGMEIGLAPFHMWLPDVYTGSHVPALSTMVLTLEMSGAYVIARIIGIYGSVPLRVSSLSIPVIILLVFAAFSVIVGELSALVQRRLRRIIGYSAVADAGYILLLALHFLIEGVSPVGEWSSYALPITFFIIASNISLASSVALIGIVEEKGLRTLDDIRGIVRESPILGGLLTVSLLSLFGTPPLAGFIAKFFVVTALFSCLRTVTNGIILFIATLVTLLFAVSSAYGLRIIQYCCVMSSKSTKRYEAKVSIFALMPVAILVSVLLLLGVAPFLLTAFF
ncbi:MAG: hypothetical protein J7L38_03955 [Thermoproteales archaeon]|nr:hypothetical protein [Thermoproteales archaeon]